MSRKRMKLPARWLLCCLLLALLIAPGSALAFDPVDRSPETHTGADTWSPAVWMASLLDWLGQWSGLTSSSAAAVTETCTTSECLPDPTTTTTTGGEPLPSGTTTGDGGDSGGQLDPWG